MYKFTEKIKFHLEHSSHPAPEIEPQCHPLENSSTTQSKEVLLAREAITTMAKDYYISLWLWFLCLGIVSFLFVSIGSWASKYQGWQAGTVEIFCYLVGTLCLLTLFMFVTLIYAWHKGFNNALNSAHLWSRDPELFQLVNRSVTGPIPWTR
jgi:hypothetical protein